MRQKLWGDWLDAWQSKQEYDGALSPPEADRETHIQWAHIVPALGRDVEHLPGFEDALFPSGLLKKGKVMEVGTLHIHLLESKNEKLV